MSGISPAKRNLTVLERNQAVIGDGDPVSVSAEIADDVLRSAKGALAVDDPIVAEELADPRRERLGMRKKLQLSTESELSLAEGTLETGHKLSAKNAAQNFHRQEEAISWSDPTCPVG